MLTLKWLSSLLLLLNLMGKDTYLIKGSELFQFNHIRILRLKSSLVPNYGLMPPAPMARSVTLSYFLSNFCGKRTEFSLKIDCFQAKSLTINLCNQQKRRKL